MRRGGIRGAVADFLESINKINILAAPKRTASDAGGTSQVSGPQDDVIGVPPGGKGKAAKLSPEEFALLSPMEKVGCAYVF